MSNITTNTQFQERMFEKIKAEMGSLLTEAELKILINTAMEKAFFGESVVKGSYWNAPQQVQPSHFVVLVKKEMEAQVAACIREWLAENSELVAKTIKETVEAGVFGMMKSHFESKAAQPMYELQAALVNKGLL